jgi:hypothetical protein
VVLVVLAIQLVVAELQVKVKLVVIQQMLEVVVVVLV